MILVLSLKKSRGMASLLFLLFFYHFFLKILGGGGSTLIQQKTRSLPDINREILKLHMNFKARKIPQKKFKVKLIHRMQYDSTSAATCNSSVKLMNVYTKYEVVILPLRDVYASSMTRSKT